MRFQIGEMTVGDILDRGLKILLGRLGVFYAINLVVLSPLVLVLVALPAIDPDPSGPIRALALLAAFAFYLILLQPISSAAVLHIIAREYVGRRVTVGEALRFALSRFGPLLGTNVLAGLIMFAPFVPVLLAALFVAAAVAPQMGVLALAGGGTLAGLWAIRFALRYALVSQVVVVEDSSGLPALSRSTGLSEGWRVRIFGIIFLILFANLVTASVVEVALEFFYPTNASLPAGLRSVQSGGDVFNTAIHVVAGQLLSIFFATYSAICGTLIYFDLRVRKEGYDLELAARQEAVPAEVM
jgi:hypothetical protein